MSKNVEAFLWVWLLVIWTMGTVLAQGWLKVLAVLFPPYTWYLVAEKLMRLAGWL